MHDGPWNFGGYAVILAPYDGILKPSTIKLETIDVWIQIHDVPDLYAHLVKPLATKVGEVLFAEPMSHDFTRNFYRVWVRINVFKPLKNAISMIRGGERQIYKVKYKRLTDSCAVYGMLGHLFKEHSNGIHPPSALVFKDLRADWSRRRGWGPGEGQDRRGGRHGGSVGSKSGGRYGEGRLGGRFEGGMNSGPHAFGESRVVETVDPCADGNDVDMEDLSRKRFDR
ncbi:hypothetical protein D1007_44758 [Hordeum vulgare]|nr:hypothetical protein D1007_44758 [Hordeum vulgare]